MQSYRSLHPNHVHQLTVCVSKHYWVNKTGILKYQLKPFELSLQAVKLAEKIHLIHYVIRDHFSGVVYAESAFSPALPPITGFLFRAWSQKDDFPFCGIPDLLMVPKTVEQVFLGVKAEVAQLGVKFPEVTSGFQSGIRDVQTLEEYMKSCIDKPVEENKKNLLSAYRCPSRKPARTGNGSKIEMWKQYVDGIRLPSADWKRSA